MRAVNQPEDHMPNTVLLVGLGVQSAVCFGRDMAIFSVDSGWSERPRVLFRLRRSTHRCMLFNRRGSFM